MCSRTMANSNSASGIERLVPFIPGSARFSLTGMARSGDSRMLNEVERLRG